MTATIKPFGRAAHVDDVACSAGSVDALLDKFCGRA